MEFMEIDSFVLGPVFARAGEGWHYAESKIRGERIEAGGLD